LFFLPWLELSCESEDELVVWGRATGWQIACGRITDCKDSPSKEAKEPAPEFESFPRRRPWVHLGLIVPAFLIVLSIGGLIGVVPGRSFLIAISVASVLGLVAVRAILTIDYTDDAARSGDRESPSTRTSKSTAQGRGDIQIAGGQEREDGFVTRVMFPVWFSLCLYGLLFIAGVGWLAALTWRERGRTRGKSPLLE